ncbi:uroporphyrinogen-III synthase [Ameyamaea chiangmaiensis NBRC 103196]|nr:uroporphyrinogen-III synthase [Ameyamaea chiangmaiensis NBRC 103196]
MLRVRAAGRATSTAPAQAVLATSGQALDYLPPDLDRRSPFYAVGDATATRARAAGFAAVDSAAGDATDLAALVAGRCVPADGPLLLLSGAGQGEELADALRGRGFRVRRRVVYAARAVSHLSVTAHRMLRHDRVDAVLLFSSATAVAFGRVAGTMGTGVRAVCISARTASVLRPEDWADVLVAARPDTDAVLDALGTPKRT